MSNLRILSCKDFCNGSEKLDKILLYHPIYPHNSIFNYNYNSIYEDIYSIDVTSFNIEFISYINRFIKSDNISQYIEYLRTLDKHNRVVEFGLFYKEVNKYTKLNIYMLAVRNIIFLNFMNIISTNSKSLQLFRMNYDDVEFNTLDQNISTDLYVNHNFLNIVKIKQYDYVIVLNKHDGVYYIKDNKIIDIKYTSGWVNIPAYRFIIQQVINFIFDENISMSDLNNSLMNYIEYSNGSLFFGYEDDDISNKYTKDDIVPTSVKYLFVAKVMSKFSILLK